MPSKAERTRQHIIESVAPIFSRKGYAGTSFADIKEATGLTKGAVYGNFNNKEELALEAFNYSIRRIMRPLNARVRAESTAIGKLKAVTAYYRKYRELQMQELHGCAILNVGVDANSGNPALLARTQEVIRKLIGAIITVIEMGQKSGTLKADLAPKPLATRMYAMIEGSIFIADTLNEPQHMVDMMDHIDRMIDVEWTV